jgi:DNA-directed RNA polymerase specialized sigma24 family protein
MPNCRSISPQAWEHAREALVFYFSRRHGVADAEDLAQDTLAALWSRADFEFEKEEDFLRVCYGFAGRVLQSGYRRTRKHTASALNPAIPDPPRTAFGLNSTEMGLLLDQVIQIGEKNLREKDWEVIQTAASVDGPRTDLRGSSDTGNVFRVRLSRARRKLVELTGWEKSST